MKPVSVVLPARHLFNSIFYARSLFMQPHAAVCVVTISFISKMTTTTICPYHHIHNPLTVFLPPTPATHPQDHCGVLLTIQSGFTWLGKCLRVCCLHRVKLRKTLYTLTNYLVLFIIIIYYGIVREIIDLFRLILSRVSVRKCEFLL